MQITLIAAVARNRAIGYRNKLIYWLPDDLKRFKQLTTGHTIIMGSNTFRSLPKGALPNRRNIVLSRRGGDFPGTEQFSSLEAAIAACTNDETVYIIGGEMLYRESISLADTLCLTEIDDTPAEADAFFPPYNSDEWEETERLQCSKNEKHPYEYAFVTYRRIKKR